MLVTSNAPYVYVFAIANQFPVAFGEKLKKRTSKTNT